VTAHAGTTTEAPRLTIDGSEAGFRLIRRLVVVNFALVALQPVSAGLLLSGYGRRAATAHAVVALALQFGALIQAVTAAVLWRRRRVPASVAAFSIGLLAMVVLEIAAGYSGRYWLHVPIGVAIFGGLMRHLNTRAV
jgi:hypothetical protein